MNMDLKEAEYQGMEWIRLEYYLLGYNAMYSVEYVSEEHMTSILESNKPSKIPT
jgi:hypothetical protein